MVKYRGSLLSRHSENLALRPQFDSSIGLYLFRNFPIYFVQSKSSTD